MKRGTKLIEHSQASALPAGAKIAVFVDFDGTLVEIADTPEAIKVPRSLKADLVALSDSLDGAFAIVTGRALEDLDRHLPGLPIEVIASHGLERRARDGAVEGVEPIEMAAAAAVADNLREFVTAHPGVRLEEKPGTVSLHYRQAPELEGAARDAIFLAMEGAPQLALMEGKMVLEVRPALTSKRSAVYRAMQDEPFRGRTPVFMGDDRTDEDGFAAVQALGGVGIKVGEGDTIANMRTAGVSESLALLRHLAGMTAEVTVQ